MPPRKAKGALKWAPAAPIRKADNIMSSAARERGESGFIPSFDKDPPNEYNMNFLMNNEYMRIWFKERAVYEKEVYSKQETEAEEKNIKRRFVQRMMTRKVKVKELPVIKLKRFSKATAKTETTRQGGIETKCET